MGIQIHEVYLKNNDSDLNHAASKTVERQAELGCSYFVVWKLSV